MACPDWSSRLTSAAAEVYLQGAHLTSWVPVGHEPVIWMSRHSTFAPGSALRGGIPVCFPWFGPHPSDGAPLHGFARVSDWTLTHVAEEGDDVRLTLTLTDTEATRSSVWPHPFAARYLVTLGATLTLALEVENTGAEAITFAEAFHTYLRVGDVRTTSITGLEQSRYVDRLAPPEWHAPDGETLRLTAESDRLYEQPAEHHRRRPCGWPLPSGRCPRIGERRRLEPVDRQGGRNGRLR